MGGWVDGGGGVGGTPTHVHTHARMHAHTHTCMCGKNDDFMQKAASIGFLGNPWEFPMMSYAHAWACMCMCIGGTLSPPPPHPPTHPSPGGPPESVKIQ